MEENSYDTTKEEIESILNDLYQDRPSFIFITGKEGVILYELRFRESSRLEYDGEPMSEDEKEAFVERLQKQLKDGLYEISDQGVKYLGDEEY